MVSHWCGVGFSQTIIYLQCLNNNGASSVLELFCTGVQRFGLPLKVHCDRGNLCVLHATENTEVARYMLERRGSNWGSVSTGWSVNNQQIERFWAELNRVVSSHFSNLLTFMENEGILDSTDELYLFCLHYIFLPRVQRVAVGFGNQWNHRGLSMQGGQIPLHLWQKGVLNSGEDGAIQDVFAGGDALNYTVGDWKQYYCSIKWVYCQSNCSVSHDTSEFITVDSLNDDCNHGKQLFLRLVNFLREH